MTDINIVFCRELLKKAHEIVKRNFPNIKLNSDAWTWHDSDKRNWEFHGPDKFYWYGGADNAYDCRYKGWMAYLREKGIKDKNIEEIY